MKLCIKYIDNNLVFNNEYINCLEVENKNKENKKEQGIRKVLLLAKIKNKEEH